MSRRRNEPPAIEQPKPAYAAGDVVRFRGGKCYTGKSVMEYPPGNVCITVIKPGTPHPFHVIHMDHESRVYGWVDEADILGPTLYRTHTIAVNETLQLIASRYGTDPDTLMELNGLASASSLQVGALLRLPDSQN